VKPPVSGETPRTVGAITQQDGKRNGADGR
jgi:hypothetical protein